MYIWIGCTGTAGKSPGAPRVYTYVQNSGTEKEIEKIKRNDKVGGGRRGRLHHGRDGSEGSRSSKFLSGTKSLSDWLSGLILFDLYVHNVDAAFAIVLHV